MRLDRFNASVGYRNKYAVIKMRELSAAISGPDGEKVKAAILALTEAGLINYGEPETSGEFFVIMLKDKFAHGALMAYANAADAAGGEYVDYGIDVAALADRSGEKSPFVKMPD